MSTSCGCNGGCGKGRTKRVLRGLPSLLFVLVVLALLVHDATAGVFHSKESALRLAFGDADSVTTEQLVLSESEAERIESLARAELPSRLIKVYVGHRDGAVLGHAFIETHRVRSLPETLLVVLDPHGRNRGVHLLAFHEPPEYQPTEAWLGQFVGERLSDELSLRRGVAGIAGSTLTANAVTACVRRVMAIHEVVLAPQHTASTRGRGAAGAP